MDRLTIILGVVSALGSVATAVGVIFAVQQIRLAKQLAQTQFEDDLTKQFRAIVYRIPIEALLGKELTEEQFNQTRDDFFHYIDLSNEQVFLRHHNRIGGATWRLWCEGIKAYLSRPSFARAWVEFKENSPGNFRELRRLEDEGFNTDPRYWDDSSSVRAGDSLIVRTEGGEISGR